MDFDLNESIKNMLAESDAAKFLDDGEDNGDGEIPDSYRNIMRIMLKQFGPSMVVHQYMAVRFQDGVFAMSYDEAQRMANAFMMGLQMSARQPDWARVIVADLDNIEPEDRDIAHAGQDALARLIPLE
jgi:hypothetical protein